MNVLAKVSTSGGMLDLAVVGALKLQEEGHIHSCASLACRLRRS